MPDSLNTRCPHCKAAIKASSQLSGKQAICPACHQAFTVEQTEQRVRFHVDPAVTLAPSVHHADETDRRSPESDTVHMTGKGQSAQVSTRANSRLEQTSQAVGAQPTSQLGSRADELSGRFGRYEIEGLLGQGGMGAVYAAIDADLDRKVAIKIPFFTTETEAKVLDRFRREAKAVAALHHANICPVFEVSSVDGVHYMAMAFIEGKPLSAVLQAEKQLPIVDAVKLVRTLALAVERAHRAGVIHRDLKPSNVMINTHGEPVIMDFGLARRQGCGDTELTQAGQLIGTPAYMSPEQVTGDVDAMGPGCDIYSLGIMLYQMLTAVVPFEGDLLAVLSAIANQQPEPPSQLRDTIDPVLEAICLKAIEKQPDCRYASMGEFAQALTDYLKGLEVADHDIQDSLLDEECDRSQPAAQQPQVALGQRRQSVTTPAPRPIKHRGHGMLIGGVASLMLLVILFVLGVQFVMDTPYGTITVEVEDGEDVRLAVLREGKEIDVIDQGGNWTLNLSEGSYNLAVKGDDNRFVIDNQTVTITRDKETKVRVSIRSQPDLATGQSTKPDDSVSLPPDPKTGGQFGRQLRVRPPQEAAIMSSLQQSTEVAFDNVALADAMDQLQSQHDLTIGIDTRALAARGLSGDVPITRRLSGISLHSALNLILQQLDLTAIVQDQRLVITTLDAAAQRLERRTYDIGSLVAANFDPDELAEAIKKLVGGSWQDADHPGGSITILSHSMIILQTQAIHEEILALLQGLQKHASGQPQLAASDSVQRLITVLGEPAEFEFSKVPLLDVVRTLEEPRQVNIEIDMRALDDVGLGSSQPMTGTAKDVSFESALSSLLSAPQLTAVIENEVLFITTEQAAAKKRQWKIYEVSGADPHQLATVIRETVIDASGQLPDGESDGIAVLPTCLVIRQSQQLHQQIADLLSELVPGAAR